MIVKIHRAGQQTKMWTALRLFVRTLRAVHPPKTVKDDGIKQTEQFLVAKRAAAEFRTRKDAPIFFDQRLDLDIQRIAFLFQYTPGDIIVFQTLGDLRFNRPHVKNDPAMFIDDVFALGQKMVRERNIHKIM